MSKRSPSSRTTSPAVPQRPQKNRQRPRCTKKTSAVRCECRELRQCGGWPAAPTWKPGVSRRWTCWSALSDTPAPMMLKFSLRSDPGVWVSMNAVRHGFSAP